MGAFFSSLLRVGVFQRGWGSAKPVQASGSPGPVGPIWGCSGGLGRASAAVWLCGGGQPEPELVARPTQIAQLAADGLDPAEDFLDPLAPTLALTVARMPGRPPVDGAAPAAVVLGDMRRHAQGPRPPDEVARVVAAVHAGRARTADAALQYLDRRPLFKPGAGCAGAARRADGNSCARLGSGGRCSCGPSMESASSRATDSDCHLIGQTEVPVRRLL